MDNADRSAYLQEVRDGKAFLILSGLSISNDFFTELLNEMPQTAENQSGHPRPVIPVRAVFDEVEFLDFIDAQHVTFASHTSMEKATFRDGAIFNGSTFQSLSLRGAHIFGTKAKFSHVKIEGTATLEGLKAETMLEFVSSETGRLLLQYSRCKGIWMAHSKVRADADFDHASLNYASKPGERTLARFDGMEIGGKAVFSNVDFPYETTFGGYADSPTTSIGDLLTFTKSTFGTLADGGRHLIQNLTVSKLDITGCIFYGKVSFSGSHFESRLRFSNVQILGNESDVGDAHNHLFPEANLDIMDISLPKGAIFENVRVDGSVAFNCSTLDGELEASEFHVSKEILISSTTFQYFPFSVQAKRLTFSRCLFARGGVISCASPDISFTECDARQPLSVLPLDPSKPASLTTLSRSNVENFALSGIDLTRAEFSAVINLEKIKLQGSPKFLRAPGLFRNRREAIIDEAFVRAPRSRRWMSLITPSQAASQRDPSDVAAIYRALRKNREDSKDEPGGGDFYYGEMEMRRLAAKKLSTAEWYLLTVYWIASGYALRAWRALAILTATLLAGAILLPLHGYKSLPPATFLDSVLLLIQVSIGLERIPTTLTPIGIVIFILCRLALPALLALAIFALRNKIKR
ncbi:hypothetical protein ABZW49_00655 [Nonomuraea wenchangensis]